MKKRASLIKRIIAQIIDLTFFALIIFLNGTIVFFLKVYYPYDIISYFLISFLFFIFNHAYLQGDKGYTLGKAFMKIKVVDNLSRPLGVAQSFIREFAKLYTPLTFFIGFFYSLSNSKRQTWHDRICSSYVIDDNSLEVYFLQLFKPVKNRHIRFFEDFDEQNYTFLNELSGFMDSKRCYKLYIDKENLVTKFGYFVDGTLVSYTKLCYEDYSTTMFEFYSNGNFSHGRRYLFNKDGSIFDIVPITKKEYETLRGVS
jgi:uncharacterized RDD family membrane protein YckC